MGPQARAPQHHRRRACRLLLTPAHGSRGRFANLVALDDDERRNKMPVKNYRTEYIIHGLFGKLGTENGFYGAYWMPVRRVAGDIVRVALELELEIFEQQQSDWRTEDLDKWEEEEAEEEAE